MKWLLPKETHTNTHPNDVNHHPTIFYNGSQCILQVELDAPIRKLHDRVRRWTKAPIGRR